MTAESQLEYRYLSTPIGKLLLAGRDGELHLVGFPTGKGSVAPQATWTEKPGCLQEAAHQLEEYFRGERQVFDLQLHPTGTPFQLSVLEALQQIPFGQTATYREIAEKIGRPKAVRAVGAANGRNPLPIVIPCHRVIGADGSLTGFGGGLETKTWLLNLESAGFELRG